MRTGRRTPMFPQRDGFSAFDPSDRAHTAVGAFMTRDHDFIRQWAARQRAEPATGEATASGPATVHVTDGGAGIRFNFPGAARFRPISWAEWFDHFDRHGLVFVCEETVADRAYRLWTRRGRPAGDPETDWFEAERQLGAPASPPSARYRLLPAAALTGAGQGAAEV